MSSPELFLNKLQRNLKHIGTKTVTFALITRFYNKFDFLFLTPVYLQKHQVKQLTDCGIRYMECIRNYVVNTATLQQRQVQALKKYIELVETLPNLKGMKKEFVQRIATTIFQTVTEPEMQLWFGKEMLRAFNSAVKYTNKSLRNNLVAQNFIYLCKFMDLLSTCGDYDYEVLLMETIFRLCSDTLISTYASTFFPECEMLQKGICDIRRSYFYRDTRVFLNSVNNKYKKVFSIKCDCIILGNIEVGAPTNHNGDKLPLWVDFNSGSETVTFKCDRDSLRTLPATRDDSAGGEWETVTIESSNVKKVLIKRLLGPYYSAYSQGCRVYFSLTPPCGVMCPSSLEAAQATHLKLSIYRCPELLQLEEVLLSMYGDKFRSLLEDKVNTMPRRKRSHVCQSPKIRNIEEPQEATAEVTHTLNQKSKENKYISENSIKDVCDDIEITKPPPAKRKCRLSISKDKDILKNTTFDNIIPLDLDTTHESISSESDLMETSELSKDKSVQPNHDSFIKETIDNIIPLDLDTTHESISSESDLMETSELSKDKSVQPNHDSFIKETIDNIIPLDLDTTHESISSESDLMETSELSKDKSVQPNHDSFIKETIDNIIPLDLDTTHESISSESDLLKISELSKDKSVQPNHDSFIKETNMSLNGFNPERTNAIDNVEPVDTDILPPSTEDFKTNSNSQVALNTNAKINNENVLSIELNSKKNRSAKEIIKGKWPRSPRCSKSGSVEAVDKEVLKQKKPFKSAVKGKKRPKCLLRKDKQESKWMAKLHKLYQKINQPICYSKEYQFISPSSEDEEEKIIVKWPGVPRRVEAVYRRKVLKQKKPLKSSIRGEKIPKGLQKKNKQEKLPQLQTEKIHNTCQQIPTNLHMTEDKIIEDVGKPSELELQTDEVNKGSPKQSFEDFANKPKRGKKPKIQAKQTKTSKTKSVQNQIKSLNLEEEERNVIENTKAEKVSKALDSKSDRPELQKGKEIVQDNVGKPTENNEKNLMDTLQKASEEVTKPPLPDLLNDAEIIETRIAKNTIKNREVEKPKKKSNLNLIAEFDKSNKTPLQDNDSDIFIKTTQDLLNVSEQQTGGNLTDEFDKSNKTPLQDNDSDIFIKTTQDLPNASEHKIGGN